MAPKCPIFDAGDALKCGFIRPHELFLVIKSSVKLSQSKLGTLLPHTWRQDSFGSSTSTWYLQVLLRAVPNTSDEEIPLKILMHLLEFCCTKARVPA